MLKIPMKGFGLKELGDEMYVNDCEYCKVHTRTAALMVRRPYILSTLIVIAKGPHAVLIVPV